MRENILSSLIRVKSKKDVEIDIMERHRMRKDTRVMNKHLCRANDISLITARRDRRAFLLSILPQDYEP